MTKLEAEIKSKEPLYILALGASAGGLDAFESFFSKMPPVESLAIVILTHLDPDHKSLMVEILTKYTEMNVSQISDATKVEPKNIYVIPPNKNVEIKDDYLYLSKYDWPTGIKHPIDYFLKSLAINSGANGLAAILTGTGSDGMLGVESIHQAGGFTFAQDPKTAQFSAMPENAISTGLIDFILPIEEMPKEISSVVKGNIQKVEEIVEDNQHLLDELYQIIKSRTGHDFSKYKESTIARRIERRMTRTDTSSLQAYIEILKEEPTEVEKLVNEFLITVTSFFRDPEAYKDLNDHIIPKIISNKGDEDSPIRVWVAGCCTGEEAYSVAILFLENLRQLKKSIPLQVFASDIDIKALELARLGRYPKTIEANMLKSSYLKDYFHAEEDCYVVKKSLREQIVFAEQNIISDPPFSSMELVTCRNLLIYFKQELQDKIIPLFHYSLKNDGFLFLGQSENLSKFKNLFQTWKNGKTFFKKLEYYPRHYRDYPLSFPDKYRRKTFYTNHNESDPNNLELIAYNNLQHRFTPPHIILNSNKEIVYNSRNSEKFLKFSSGRPSLEISRLLIPEFSFEVNANLHQAIKRGEDQKTKPIKFQIDRKIETFITHIRPIKSKQTEELDLIILVFETVHLADKENTQIEASLIRQSEDQTRDEYIESLKTELEETKERLKVSIEEIESSREEMKASNEELMSMNEELQSTNEELETSKEELQSLNEELSTVNNELYEKNQDLTDANNYLDNLFRNTSVAIIFLNSNWEIQKFTPSIKTIFNLKSSDTGRSIKDFSSVLKYEELFSDIDKVLTNLNSITKTIETTDNKVLRVSLNPYRTYDDKIDGIVISFTDITAVHESQKMVSIAERRFRTAIKNSKVILFEHDKDLRYTWIENQPSQYPTPVHHVLGKTDLELGNSPERKELYERKKRAIESGFSDRFTFKEEFGGQLHYYDIFIEPINDSDTGDSALTCLAIDITEEKQREEKISSLSKFPDEDPNPVIRVTETGEITYRNQSTSVLLDAQKYAIGSVLPSSLKEVLQQAIKSGEEIYTEYENNELTFSLVFTPIKDKNYLNIYAHDISKRVKAEKERSEIETKIFQASKLESLGTLAAGVAHEINNPLAIIHGCISNALRVGENELSPAIVEMLELSSDAVTRIANITRRIGIFTRSDSDSDSLVEVFDVNIILKKIIDSFTKLPDADNHLLKLDLHKEPVYMKADKEKIKSVFINLIKNAKDAMPTGGTVKITTDIKKNNLQEMALITVQDHGQGMDKEVKSKIFNPFFTTKEIGKGTGIGLSLSYGVISEFHGKINVESEPEQGTCFYVELPLELEPTVVDEKEFSRHECIKLSGKVLLVDDEVLIRKVIQSFLEDIGFQVDTAENGSHALNKLMENSYDVLITDIMMPYLDGWELLDKIHASQLDQDLKIVIYSGYDISAKELNKKLGFKNPIKVFQKPIKLEELYDHLLKSTH